MNERFSSPKSFSPSDMADALKRSRGISAVVAVPETNQPELMQIERPCEGKRIEIDDRTYEYAKVPTGKMVYNRETRQLEPGFHSLRTYFSHSTEGIGPGPGWDLRLNLPKLSDDEMLERYGHVFSCEEIFEPSGSRELDGSLSGGMPDDVHYYDLASVDE